MTIGDPWLQNPGASTDIMSISCPPEIGDPWFDALRVFSEAKQTLKAARISFFVRQMSRPFKVLGLLQFATFAALTQMSSAQNQSGHLMV